MPTQRSSSRASRESREREYLLHINVCVAGFATNIAYPARQIARNIPGTKGPIRVSHANLHFFFVRSFHAEQAIAYGKHNKLSTFAM